MAPKASDKAQKQKIAEDKTFGMKNKNKSKSVQKYIKSITANITGQSRKQEDEERKEKKAKAEEDKKKALMAGLFNMQTDKKGKAYDPVAKKQAKQQEEESIAAGKKLKEDVRKQIIEGIANSIQLSNPKGVRLSELGGQPIIVTLKEKFPDVWKILSLLLFIKANKATFWIDDDESTNPIVRVQADVDAEVEPDERPIEDIIEERRAALPPGGTPVTPETFKAWKEKKEAERKQKAEEARVAESKKSGGKGLAALSGRDLFTFDPTLFVDDDEAVGEDAYEERQSIHSDDEVPERAPAIAEAGAAQADEDDDDDDGEDFDLEGAQEAAFAAQAAASSSAAPAAINAELFLKGEDLPDDLDDLDDDE